MKKNLIWGLVLILLAVYLIAGQMGIAPMISVVKIAATVLFAYIVVKGIIKAHFMQIFFGLSIIYCLYLNEIAYLVPAVNGVSNWVVVVAACLIGGGLDLIFKDVFKKSRHHFGAKVYDSNGNIIDGEFVEDDGNGRQETAFTSQTSNVNSDSFRFENSFGEVSKYVNSNDFSFGKAENSFGSMNIYMDNVVFRQSGATLEIENSFGETNIYLPSACKFQMKQDASFGNIKLHGNATGVENAPVVFADISSSFGDVNVFFK